MTRLEDLRGRVAVISGAGSGIGAGLARFASTGLGMTVVLADWDLTRAEEVAEGLRANGAVAVAVRMDVGDWTSVRHGADDVLAKWGVPAFLACNAGIEHTGLAWEVRPEDWERVQRVNRARCLPPHASVRAGNGGAGGTGPGPVHLVTRWNQHRRLAVGLSCEQARRSGARPDAASRPQIGRQLIGCLGASARCRADPHLRGCAHHR